MLTESFYWDTDDATRAWSKRFFRPGQEDAEQPQVGVYSSTMHYLQAVAGAGTDETTAVMKMMRATPIDDIFAHDGHIRADGVMVHDMRLYQVKTPSESHYPGIISSSSRRSRAIRRLPRSPNRNAPW